MGKSGIDELMQEAYEHEFFIEVKGVLENQLGKILFANSFESEDQFESWRRKNASTLPRWIKEAVNLYQFDNILCNLKGEVDELYKRRELDTFVNKVRKKQGLDPFKITYPAR